VVSRSGNVVVDLRSCSKYTNVSSDLSACREMDNLTLCVSLPTSYDCEQFFDYPWVLPTTLCLERAFGGGLAFHMRDWMSPSIGIHEVWVLNCTQGFAGIIRWLFLNCPYLSTCLIGPAYTTEHSHLYHVYSSIEVGESLAHLFVQVSKVGVYTPQLPVLELCSILKTGKGLSSATIFIELYDSPTGTSFEDIPGHLSKNCVLLDLEHILDVLCLVGDRGQKLRLELHGFSTYCVENATLLFHSVKQYTTHPCELSWWKTAEPCTFMKHHSYCSKLVVRVNDCVCESEAPFALKNPLDIDASGDEWAFRNNRTNFFHPNEKSQEWNKGLFYPFEQ
jgi:hypothetical protein